MIIEIRGTGTQNKGAELMLCAIRQYFAERNPDVKFAVDPQFGPYAARAKYELLSKVRPPRFNRARISQAFMSAGFRQTYGLVTDSDIDAVLDASGFAFGDAWGPGPSDQLAKQAMRWKRRGIKSILLPQAFGPFENQEVQTTFRNALDNLTLVFARDKVSYDYVQSLGGPFEHVRQGPDFTNIVKGIMPTDIELPQVYACVVPNSRMLDKGSISEQNAYMRFLTRSVHLLRSNRVAPIAVCHEFAQDPDLARLICRKVGNDLPIVLEQDPIRLKGITQGAKLVIGSRFHALVGSLSQAVPTIGTSWSHKYEALFDDYDCRDCLTSPSIEESQLEALVSRVFDLGQQAELRQRLSSRAAAIRQQVETMFQEVTRTLKR